MTIIVTRTSHVGLQNFFVIEPGLPDDLLEKRLIRAGRAEWWRRASP